MGPGGGLRRLRNLDAPGGGLEVERALSAQLDVFEEFQIDPEEFFEGGEQVVVFVRQRARGGASGAEVEIRVGHLWTIRGGRAVRLEIFPERRKALDAAGLGDGPRDARP